MRRREFFSAAATAAIGGGVSRTLIASGNPHINAAPRPIPGGVSPFGVFIHHFPLPPATTPLTDIGDPSQITDFNGFVALNHIEGTGSGTGFPVLSYRADMGFMDGVYVAVDGKQYHGIFGFI